MSISRGVIRRTNAANRFGVWALIGVGIASTLLYALGITARYPLAIGLRSPRAGWATLVGSSLNVGVVFAGVYALLIVTYVVALRLILRLRDRRPRQVVGIIIAGWLLSSTALLGAYPGESFDIFDYVFRGRMIVEYGASPLATAPAVFLNQPFYNYITWRGQVDTYGPLWEYASGAVAWAVHDVFGRAGSLVAYIVGYRLLAVLLTGLCGLLIALIVRHNAPQLVSAALLAWLWNPLVLITTAIGAHNDLLMIVAIFAALLLFQRQRWVGGLLALALAAHVKLTALTNSFARNQPGSPLNDTHVGAINSLAQVAPLLCVLLVTRIWHDAPRLLAATRRVHARSRSTVARAAAAHEMDHRS